jgi:predicted transposase YbfD/YdcC
MDGSATGDSAFFRDVFNDLPDPRTGPNVIHKLHDLIVLAICGILCGADSWTEIEEWSEARFEFYKTFLDLPGGVPSHDTFGRVFGMLDPDAFERCFIAWTQGVAAAGNLVAIDGKSLRRSFEHAWDKSGMAHMVSAFASANRMVLAQTACLGKGQELEAIVRLLGLIDLKGAVVTIDAMGCQKQIAQIIAENQGDYVLAVKENQPTLHTQVKGLLDEMILENFAGVEHGFVETRDDAHGRIETRKVWVTDQIASLACREDWAGLSSVAVVESTRQDLGDLSGKITTERRYFISSLKGCDAKRMAGAVRGHWGIENSLHWVLDMTFREDERRIRKDHGAENFSRLCRIALNQLKKETSKKRRSLRVKRKLAGWSNDYLMKLLTL